MNLSPRGNNASANGQQAAGVAISTRLTSHDNDPSIRSPELQRLINKILALYGPQILDELMQSPRFPNNAYLILGETEMLQSTPVTEEPIPAPQARSTSQRHQPVWPPGPTYTLNTKTMQIQERRQINTNLWSDNPFNQTLNTFGHADKVNNLRRPFECTFNIRKAKCPLPQSYYDQESASNRLNQYKLTQPRFEPDSTETEISPLQNYLHPTGNRVTDRIGLPFKAMAQRRSVMCRNLKVRSHQSKLKAMWVHKNIACTIYSVVCSKALTLSYMQEVLSVKIHIVQHVSIESEI